MAPPRARTAKNRDLPANLYPNGKYWQEGQHQQADE